ncbi:MAG: ParM/StbA family protein [Clostridia bacterium]|nr:ParM/StbA family protein [Clostridia bacterium]
MITDFNNPNRPVIIGLDHGFGNVKTAHTCFQAGVTKHEKEPTFKSSMLFYDGWYYTIGEEHKEFIANKINDQDFFILTLAGIASELAFYGRLSANVHLAVGLPLTWVAEQKDDFKKYLMQRDPREEIIFTFKGKEYRIRITGVDVFPQGFAAIVSHLSDFKGVNMLCDIGNGTMNVMTIINGRPISSKCFTEKYGTHQCTLLIRERLMQKYHVTVDDAVIEEVLRTGAADIGKPYLETIIEAAKEYTEGILRRLREHEYNPALMRLYIVGGGGCLVKNFADLDADRVTINEDICATAKGYEYMANARMRKAG